MFSSSEPLSGRLLPSTSSQRRARRASLVLLGLLLFAGGTPDPVHRETVETIAVGFPQLSEGSRGLPVGRGLGWPDAVPMLLPGMRARYDYRGRVWAQDLRTGAVRWRYTRAGASIRDWSHAGPEGTDLLIHWSDGVLTMVDGRTGWPRWHRTLPAGATGDRGDGPDIYPAAAAGGVLLVRGQRMWLLDDQDGVQRWTAAPGGRSDGQNCAVWDAAVTPEFVLVTTLNCPADSGHALYALRTSDGRQAWSAGRSVAGIRASRTAIAVNTREQPALVDARTHKLQPLTSATGDDVLLPGLDGVHAVTVNTTSPVSRLAGYDLHTGGRTWTVSTPAGTQLEDGGFVHNGRVYLVTHQIWDDAHADWTHGRQPGAQRLWILDAGTGRQVASVPLPAPYSDPEQTAIYGWAQVVTAESGVVVVLYGDKERVSSDRVLLLADAPAS